MTSFLETIRMRFAQPKTIPAGIYQYQAPQEDPQNIRLHLRVENDGNSILIINASTILHLNKTATEYAYHLINQDSNDDVATVIASRYQTSKEQASLDYADFVDRIRIVATTSEIDPIMYLDFDRKQPHSGDISGPYRLDCALTYRVRATDSANSAPAERTKRELSTLEWKTIFDKAWQAGIPHILLTGGEPNLREDLFELIMHAESNGQVTGLLTRGYRLSDSEYLNSLLQTGLDHLLFVLNPEEKLDWSALEKILPGDLFTTVHITVNKSNQDNLSDLLKRLVGLGVKSLSLSANSEQLSEALIKARQEAASLGLSLVWDMPVPYSALNPFEMEFLEQGRLSGAGHTWLYIEPDGDVLPGQGVNKVLGNFLSDPWAQIWMNR
jgi:organic radical activating enzyme